MRRLALLIWGTDFDPALRPLLAGERASFNGQAVHCEAFRLRGPLPSAELTVAAFGPRMIQAAAEIADRVVLNLVTPDQVAHLHAQLADAAAEAGRPPPPITVWVPVGEAGSANEAQLAGQLAVYLPAPGYAEMLLAAGFGDLVERARKGARRQELQGAITRDVLDAIGAIGPREAIAARLAAYRAAGADTVAVVPATGDDPAGRRALAAVASATRSGSAT